VEKESHGRGARHLARTRTAPYCTLIGEPSDWQGLTLGYKGLLAFDYRLLQPGSQSAGKQSRPAEKAVALWNKLMIYSTEHNAGDRGILTRWTPPWSAFAPTAMGCAMAWI
jgi:LysW-gamma-L-lysine carboxypeptidase